jgi:hypothetical protein
MVSGLFDRLSEVDWAAGWTRLNAVWGGNPRRTYGGGENPANVVLFEIGVYQR